MIDFLSQRAAYHCFLNSRCFLLSWFQYKSRVYGEDRGIDYDKLKSSASYKEYKSETLFLQTVSLDELSENERKAFFISILCVCLVIKCGRVTWQVDLGYMASRSVNDFLSVLSVCTSCLSVFNCDQLLHKIDIKYHDLKIVR